MKKGKNVATGLLIALSLLLAVGCDAEGSGGGGESTGYAIGDTGPSGVGIVFYVTDGGLHGLEAAPADQSTSAAWSTITDAYANGSTALPVAIGTGSANTDAIILQNSGAASAAKICRDYRASEEGDWFLPSKDELDQLYSQKDTVGSLDGDFYWSSSESGASRVWVHYFPFGRQGSYTKDQNCYVRAIRAF